MSLLRSQLASGGWRRLLWRNPRAYKYSGSFVTAGTADPTVLKGKGFTVARTETGELTVTLDRAFKTLVSLTVTLEDVSNSTARAFPLLSSGAVGDFDTPASFKIITQTSAGSAADLTGPIVHFSAEFSDQVEL